jgi:deferrochelatase/peroxidase EfeB
VATVSTPVPLDRMETPTLLFGALSGLAHAACLRVRFDADAAAYRAWLGSVAPHVSYGHAAQDRPAIVLALTAGGLRALGLDEADLDTFPAAFVNGMTSPERARALGDVGPHAPDTWDWVDEPDGDKPGRVHALLLVYAGSGDALEQAISAIHNLPHATAVAISEPIWLQTRDRNDQREPFGFRDGLSQPVLAGTPAAQRAENQKQVMAAGEFVLGYADNRGFMPPVPSVAHVRQSAAALPRLADGRYDLGRNSTFLVARQLRQNVKAFRDWVAAQAVALGTSPDYVAAKLVGRWPNGASLVRHPTRAGKQADNDFNFEAEDADGLACPLGAHIRRANPRDSLHPEAADPLAIVNRHRIIRVGRPYVAEPGGSPEGLLFLCLNGDIERQFELVQQSWLLREDFGGLRGEQDPVTGLKPGARTMTVPTLQGPQRLAALPTFVTPIGGGYFWLPSRAAVHYLCTAPA